jgi:hypothetical protein
MTAHTNPLHLVVASSPTPVTTVDIADPRLPRGTLTINARWLGITWTARVENPYGHVDELTAAVLRQAPTSISFKVRSHPEHLRATATVRVADLHVPAPPVPAVPAPSGAFPVPVPVIPSPALASPALPSFEQLAEDPDDNIVVDIDDPFLPTETPLIVLCTSDAVGWYAVIEIDPIQARRPDYRMECLLQAPQGIDPDDLLTAIVIDHAHLRPQPRLSKARAPSSTEFQKSFGWLASRIEKARQGDADRRRISTSPLPFSNPQKQRGNGPGSVSQAAYNEQMLGTAIPDNPEWTLKRQAIMDKDARFMALVREGLYRQLEDVEAEFIEAMCFGDDAERDHWGAQRNHLLRLIRSAEKSYETWLWGLCSGQLTRLTQFNSQICISRMQARCRPDAIALEQFLVSEGATGSMLTVSAGFFPVEQKSMARSQLVKTFRRAKKNLWKSNSFGALGIPLDFISVSVEVTYRSTAEMQVETGRAICDNGVSQSGLYIHPHLHILVRHPYITGTVEYRGQKITRYQCAQDIVLRTFQRCGIHRGLRIKTVNWRWFSAARRNDARKIVAEVVKYTHKGTKLHLVDNNLTARQCAEIFAQSHGARNRIYMGSFQAWRQQHGLTPRTDILGREDPDCEPIVLHKPASKICRLGDQRSFVHRPWHRVTLKSRTLVFSKTWTWLRPQKAEEELWSLDVQCEDPDDPIVDDAEDCLNGERPSSVVGMTGLTAMPGGRRERHLVMRGVPESFALQDALGWLRGDLNAAYTNQQRYIYNARSEDQQGVPYIDSSGNLRTGFCSSSEDRISGTAPPIFFLRDGDVVQEEVEEHILAEMAGSPGSQSTGILQTQVVPLRSGSVPTGPSVGPTCRSNGPPQGAQAPP